MNDHTTPPAAAEEPVVRAAVRDAIAEALGSSAYSCTRVWEAWSIGTMSKNDFVPLVEVDGWLDDLTDTVMATLAARVAELEAERDEADRRTGSLGRRLKTAEENISARTRWLRKAKVDRGYHENISFDAVWAEACAKADALAIAEQRVAAVEREREAAREVIRVMEEIATEAYAHWDADRNSKVGKYLGALGGGTNRVDLNQARAALAAAAPAALPCPKAPHIGTGYMHDESDDTPYSVDGLLYCGRCHFLCNQQTGECSRPITPGPGGARDGE